jgi:tRNA A-37 threonylcarbamoyl transferase component Bud32
MVVNFNIIESVKIIDKELSKLEKKSDKEIDDLYAKDVEKVNPKLNFLYHIFDKYYKDISFITKLKSSLSKHKLPLHFLSFPEEIDYIKNFGYSEIKEIGKGFYGTVYLSKKNSKKYAIKIQQFNYDYGILDNFLESNINEYNKLKKLNKYAFSPKVYEIMFIFNQFTNELYSLIVMEHIQGITLQKYKDKKGKLDVHDKQKLNDKITKLHKLGIYHSDLHFENIIAVKKGKNYDFIFIDFGLAKSEKNMKNKAKNNNKAILKNNFSSFGPKTNEKNKKLYIALAKIVNNGAIDVIS